MKRKPNIRRIEQRSIDYVPISERHGRAWHLGPVWFSGNAQLATLTSLSSESLGGGGIHHVIVGNLVRQSHFRVGAGSLLCCGLLSVCTLLKKPLAVKSASCGSQSSVPFRKQAICPGRARELLPFEPSRFRQPAKKGPAGRVRGRSETLRWLGGRSGRLAPMIESFEHASCRF